MRLWVQDPMGARVITHTKKKKKTDFARRSFNRNQMAEQNGKSLVHGLSELKGLHKCWSIVVLVRPLVLCFILFFIFINHFPYNFERIIPYLVSYCKLTNLYSDFVSWVYFCPFFFFFKPVMQILIILVKFQFQNFFISFYNYSCFH